MEKQEILTKLLKDDLKPALGVTEPGAIAYAVSLAVQQLAKQSPDSTPERVKVVLNSGIYKNAFTCAIPNSEHLGNEYAAALGLLGADPSRLLECLSTVHQMDREAEKLISQGKVTVELGEISADISIDSPERMEKPFGSSSPVRTPMSVGSCTAKKRSGKMKKKKSTEKKNRQRFIVIPFGSCLTMCRQFRQKKLTF